MVLKLKLVVKLEEKKWGSSHIWWEIPRSVVLPWHWGDPGWEAQGGVSWILSDPPPPVPETHEECVRNYGYLWIVNSS